MALQTKLWTVTEAAEEIGVSGARIRQLCLELELGQMVGKMRLLDDREVKQLKELPDRRRKNFRNNT